jgi:hypothetical protein
MPLPTGGLVRAAYTFVRGHWGTCCRALWLPLLLIFLLLLAIGPRLLCLFASSCSTSTPLTMRCVEILVWLMVLVASVALLVAMMQAVVWRFMLGNAPPPKYFYFAVGKDELRLVALRALQIGLCLLASAGVFLAVGLVVVGLGLQFGPLLAPILVLTLIAAFAAAGFVNTRLSLAGPAAIDLQRMTLSYSWRATHGRLLGLRCVDAGIAVPIFGLGVVTVGIFLASLLLPGLANLLALFATLPTAEACRLFLRALAFPLSILMLLLYLLALAFWSLLTAARALEYRASRDAGGSGP